MLWMLIRIASPILMSTHNIGFYEDLTKIIFELSSISSNTHLISSAEYAIRQPNLGRCIAFGSLQFDFPVWHIISPVVSQWGKDQH